MRLAMMKLTGVSGQIAIVTFQYNTISSNTWTCAPGYLGAAKGTWYSRYIEDWLVLEDDNGDRIATVTKFGTPAFGYPFDGKKGHTGLVGCWKSGAIFYRDVPDYEVLSV
jgi:hypothetical protein